MLDIFAWAGLDWIYDRVEGRCGRLTAWLVTMALALAIIASAAAILFALL
jgi:hypothetical protein